MPLIEVFRAKPPQLGTCTSCGKRIEWVITVATGKRMPLDSPIIIERQYTRLDGSRITRLDAGGSHFATCPKADQHRGRPDRQRRLF